MFLNNIRADISGSLRDLSEPYFQRRSSGVRRSTRRCCPEVKKTLAPGFQTLHDAYGLGFELFDILFELGTITDDVNTINPPQSEAIPLRVHKKIRLIQYDLLAGENYNLNKSRDQLLNACRLGALLYTAIIQNDFWVSSISEKLILQLKSCLEGGSRLTKEMSALRLWLMFLAGSLALGPTEKSWFVCSIAQTAFQLSLSSWRDAKLLLETFAWTGKGQDGSGRELWEEAMGKPIVLL